MKITMTGRVTLSSSHMEGMDCRASLAQEFGVTHQAPHSVGLVTGLIINAVKLKLRGACFMVSSLVRKKCFLAWPCKQ